MPRQMPKNGMPRSRAKRIGLDLAFDAALAEAAGHEDAVDAGEQPLGAFALDRLAVDALDADLGPIVRCRRGRALRRSTCRRRGARRICRPRRCVISCSGLRRRWSRSRQSSRSSGPAGEAQLADDQLVEAVVDQAQRHFVDRKILVLLLDHGLDGHVAEQGDFRLLVAAQRRFGAADRGCRAGYRSGAAGRPNAAWAWSSARRRP